jgi:hypothetical protein
MLLGDVQDQAKTSTPVDSSISLTGSMDILKHIQFHYFNIQPAIFKHICEYIRPLLKVIIGTNQELLLKTLLKENGRFMVPLVHGLNKTV